LFYSKIEVIATEGEVISNVIPEEQIDKDEKNTNEEYNENQDNEDEYSSAKNPLDELKYLEVNSEGTNNSNVQIDTQNVVARYFYYDQLDEYGKKIYDKLNQNIDEFKTGNYVADFGTEFNDLLHTDNGSEVLNKSFQLAINALTFDNPELFYIDVTKINMITEITTKAFSKTYRITISGNGNKYLSDEFYDENTLNQAIEEVNNIKSQVINMATSSSDDVTEQLRTIHDYLVDTIEYDKDFGNDVYNIYGALINRRAVCEGYARAFKDILDEMGIPCIIAVGVGQNSEGVAESHAWNYVKINSIWYAIDVTWDDPVGANGRLPDSIKYNYFLVGSNKLFQDHVEDGIIADDYQFIYPTLSEQDY
jgi:hypothetical protein